MWVAINATRTSVSCGAHAGGITAVSYTHLDVYKRQVCTQRSDDMCPIAYTPGRLKDVLDYLRDTELRIYGCTDFEYTLLEDEWHKLYQKDRQIAVISVSYTHLGSDSAHPYHQGQCT